jgi:hypothetical protein
VSTQGDKTAFDIDIDSMEEKPWRKPGKINIK